MGAFGLGAFDNDDALDYVDELVGSKGSGMVISAIDEALAADYLEMPEASSALVACEILAAKNQRASAGLPADVLEWVDRSDFLLTESLLKRAQSAVSRIQTDSELADEWGESDVADEWVSFLSDLRERLDAT